MKKKPFKMRLKKDWVRNRSMYILMLPIIAYFILFHYKPMYGVIIAFQDYRIARGITGSEWIGLENFREIFQDVLFPRTLWNTFRLSLEGLFFSWPVPIIFALLLNEVKVSWFKRTVQTVTYLPHFISVVVVCTLIHSFCASEGLINTLLGYIGIESTVALLTKRSLFDPIYVLSGIWSSFGWGSIIYLAALAGIDQEQYEAARIDGASRLQQMRFITFPGLMPTISMMLILRMGDMLAIGREKILLLYNDLTMEVADVFSTYNYRKGLLSKQYSYSTAFTLFNNLVSIILVLTANKISKKLGQSGLF